MIGYVYQKSSRKSSLQVQNRRFSSTVKEIPPSGRKRRDFFIRLLERQAYLRLHFVCRCRPRRSFHQNKLSQKREDQYQSEKLFSTVCRKPSTSSEKRGAYGSPLNRRNKSHQKMNFAPSCIVRALFGKTKFGLSKVGELGVRKLRVAVVVKSSGCPIRLTALI